MPLVYYIVAVQDTGAEWHHAALEPIMQVVLEQARSGGVQIDTLIPISMEPCDPTVFEMVRTRAMN